MLFHTLEQRIITRDRLLDYDFSIVPAVPHSAGLNLVYPWENFTLVSLSKQILTLARQNGYEGDESTFWSRFAEGIVHTGTIDSFPIPGCEQDLYLDNETEILYYFKATTETIYTELAARVGVAIVGQSIIEDTQEIITYLYIPVRALLIEDTILNCGSAEEVIEDGN